MKPLIVATTLLLAGQAALGQAVARLHFLVTDGLVAYRINLVTTFNPDRPIELAPREWVTVETDADSIGLITNRQTSFMPVQPGKEYYFLIYRQFQGRFTANAVSEQEFMLTYHINKFTRQHPYSLRKKPN